MTPSSNYKLQHLYKRCEMFEVDLKYLNYFDIKEQPANVKFIGNLFIY